MSRLGVAVIGMGMIGRLHARIVSEHARLDLVSVHDLHREVGEAAAAEFGTTASDSLEQTLRDPAVDAVIVCTPEHLHAAPVSAALQAGKHVLVEKPLATTVAEAESMVALAAASGQVLLVAHLLRFDPRYAHARAAVVSGRLGPLTHVWGRRCNPRTAAQRVSGRVSLVHYLGVHEIDAALWVTGQEPVNVFARSTSLVNAAYGTEDEIFVLMRLSEGTVASLQFGWNLPERLGVRIYGGFDVVGRDGAIQIDLARTGLHEIGREGPMTHDPHYWPEVNGRIVGDLAAEVDHFASCVLDGETPRVTPNEALRTVRIADAILQSAASERVVWL